VPVFVLGQDYIGHTKFVGRSPFRALTKSNYNATMGYARNWYSRIPNTPCTGRTGTPTGNDCDEYPYFTTKQGGPNNYPEVVNLEPVNIGDNRGAGGKLRAFFGACDVDADAGPASNFLVATIPNLPTSGWICRR